MVDDVLNQTAQSQIRSIVERVERLEADKAEIAEHIKEVLAEAKASGLDVKIIRKVVKTRKVSRAKRQEEEALTDLYMAACGELPLFESRDASPIISMTIATAGGGSVTAPIGMVKEALDHVRGDTDLYAEARDLVLRDGKASTSYVQRKLQLGYNKAAAYIERMEREGLISPSDHAGKREVLAQAAH